MLPEYLIDLPSLNKATLDEKFLGIDIILLDDWEDSKKIALGSLLRDMKKKNLKTNYLIVFNDYNSEYYFPLLLNYLAIIDIKMIREFMTAHFTLLEKSRVVELCAFISKYKKAIFSQFKWSINGITSKDLIIEDWVNNYSQKHTLRQKPDKETEFFKLTQYQIDRYTNELINKSILNIDSKDVFIQYLNNDFTQVLKLKANKTQVANMFLVLNETQTRKNGDLKELASKLHKNLYAFDKGKYCKIRPSYLYILLTDISKAPKNPIISR
jgi:hypothetical protein